MLPAIARLERVLANNSPALMTAVGVAGTVSTAVLAAKAGAQANILILEAEEFEGHNRELTPKEKVDLTWKVFVPTAASATLTVVAIVAANRIGARRAAGLAAALSLGEKAYSEYQDKMVETLGRNKEELVRTEIIKEKAEANPAPTNLVVVGTDVKCYDAYTDRYFSSNVDKIKKAENEFNRDVINQSYASLSELYTYLGLPRTSHSDEIGFTTDRLLEIQITAHLGENDMPYIAIDYHPTSIRHF